MRARRLWRALVGLLSFTGAVARADAPSSSVPSPAEQPEPGAAGPSLPDLQRAAVLAARMAPEHIDAIERRMRVAALLPQLRVRVGRGTGQILTTSEYDGTARLSVGDRDAWQVDLSAAWSLDRLVYHGDELRLIREIQRVAAHRERLVKQVADLYAERRRLQQLLARPHPPLIGPFGTPSGTPSGTSADDLAARHAAVTATLDALTGGALLRER